MKAEIIAVGSELLTPERTDTNSLYLTEKLNEIGIQVHLKTIVGDDEANLEHVLRGALERSDIIISSGGLGPTEDDITRPVFARVLGRELRLDQQVLEFVRRRFEERGLKMGQINVREAMVPEGATPLLNRVGTAPGLYIEHDNKRIVMLPGPPRELQPMFEEQVLPRLRAFSPERAMVKHVFRIAGLTETETETIVAPIYTQYPRVRTTILAAPGQIELHFTAEGKTRREAEGELLELEARVRQALGENIFSTRGETLEEVVARVLSESGQTLAVAESCTGGLVGERLTRVQGSSRYFLGGIICYSRDAKVRICGVPADLIESKGEVSGEVAEKLAEGARKLYGATIGLGVVGVAGPTGGTEENPVGTVIIGLAREGSAFHRRYRFHGERQMVRWRASQWALDLVRRQLMKEVDGK